MGFTVLLLLAGLALAVILFVATGGGHLLFLPIFLVVPLGLLGLGRRRR